MKKQICLWLSAFLLITNLTTAQTSHPLDPLNSVEISSAVKILRASANFPKAGLFSTVVLHEPPKDEVLAYAPGKKFRREAFAVVYDRINNNTFETIYLPMTNSVGLEFDKPQKVNCIVLKEYLVNGQHCKKFSLLFISLIILSISFFLFST